MGLEWIGGSGTGGHALQGQRQVSHEVSLGAEDVHTTPCFCGHHFLSDYHDYSHRLPCPICTTSSKGGRCHTARKTVLADVSILEVVLGTGEAD